MWRTAILIGCFRRGEAENPEIYVTAIAAVLSDYPEAVVVRVTDPRIGIAGRSKWLPTVFEVRKACEREMEPIRAAQRRDAERQRTRQIVDARASNRIPLESWTKLRQAIELRDVEHKPVAAE